MRDNGDTDRVREVPLTEKQKAIIEKITGFNCDEVETLTMTITESIDTNTPKEESLEKVKEGRRSIWSQLSEPSSNCLQALAAKPNACRPVLLIVKLLNGAALML